MKGRLKLNAISTGLDNIQLQKLISEGAVSGISDILIDDVWAQAKERHIQVKTDDPCN